MSTTNVIVLIVLVILAVIFDVLIRRLDKINMAKNAIKGIEPSRGQKYPIYLSVIFLGAFLITLGLYLIYKYI